MSLGFSFSVRPGNFSLLFCLGRGKEAFFAVFLAHCLEKGISKYSYIARSSIIQVSAVDHSLRPIEQTLSTKNTN